MAIHIEQVVNERGRRFCSAMVIYSSYERSECSNIGYTFDTTCAVAAACDHLRSDSRLMQGVRHYTYGDICGLADNWTSSVNGNMYKVCQR